MYRLSHYPGIQWTHFQVPLQPDAGWTANDLNGSPFTGDQMLRLLSALDQMWIRAEYRHGKETDCLDNVRLLAPACNSDVLLTLRRTASGDTVLEWPTNACGFAVEASSNISSLNWTTNIQALEWETNRSLHSITDRP